MTFSIVRVALIAMLALAVAAGCTSRKTSDKSLVLVDADTAEQLSHGEKKLIGGRLTAAFVDCRGESEFAAGHIPGAVPLAFQNVTEEHKSKLGGFDTFIVYGRDYGDPKANAMSKRLIELGYNDVRTLDGGLQAWREAGYRVEKGDEAASADSGEEG